jgi:hypothetical protein
VNQASQVDEPLLQLKWSDSGRPTVFLGWFGERTRWENVFVDSAVLYCHAATTPSLARVEP